MVCRCVSLCCCVVFFRCDCVGFLYVFLCGLCLYVIVVVHRSVLYVVVWWVIKDHNGGYACMTSHLLFLALSN